MKTYIITGSNDFVYDLFDTDSPQIVQEHINQVRQNHIDANYPFYEPKMFYIYEVTNCRQFDMLHTPNLNSNES